MVMNAEAVPSVGGLAVVLVLEQLRSIGKVMEQLLNQFPLAFGGRGRCRSASPHPHEWQCTSCTRLPCPIGCSRSFLYELCHGLHRLLEVQCILERDASVGALHIPDGLSTQALVFSFVDVGVVGDDLSQHIEIHALLEQERAHAPGIVIQCAGHHGRECFGQKGAGVLSVQVADIKPERLLNELSLLLAQLSRRR